MKYSLLREPYPSEIKYFKENPHVAGMATEDERVIFNPYSDVHPKNSDSIYLNEASRIHMKKSKKRPKFKLTDEQKEAFKDYGEEQDIRETIAARIISGDESAGDVTSEQKEYANSLRNQMIEGGY